VLWAISPDEPCMELAKWFLMRTGMLLKLALPTLIAVFASQTLSAQDLAPRAYVITPVNSNAITLAGSFYDGGLNFNGTVPITGATGTYGVSIFSYYHSFGILGRSANITGSLPYGIGHFQGSVLGSETHIYRSGLLDAGFRVSVNLKGGPAMPPLSFVKWKQTALLGVSFKVVAPIGQYDPTRLVNWGINRWAFKPELGYSRRWGKTLLDAYAGAWFYTTNPASYSIPVPKPQTEAPIGSFEGHLSYDVKPLLWFSIDGNFWVGGVTSLNGIQNLKTHQTGSRVGITGSFRLSKHQSFKVSYSDGIYILFGGNYQNVSAAWQYSWIGKQID
jgi:hypothetical protein